LSGSLFGDTKRSVLALLYGHADEAFYLRQITRAVGMGHGAVQRELKQLTESGVLTRSVHGNQVYFQANRQCPIFEELRRLMVKTAGAAEVLRDALAPLRDKIEAAFVYGSLARGEEVARSDVDVMVVGNATFDEVLQALGPVEEQLGRETNPTVYSANEFKEKLTGEQHFLTSVLKGPKIMLIGEEDDLRGLAPT
jgi:predicted nucleotidyltransferase